MQQEQQALAQPPEAEEAQVKAPVEAQDQEEAAAAMTEEILGDAPAPANDGPGDTAPDFAADLRTLEAILFASVEPLSTHAIRERVGQDKDVGGLLLALKAHYEGRGVHLVEMDGSWAFRTATDLGDALQITKEVQRKMSRAAMETLAIVAYHQPITRAEIENIRGVATNKGTLDVLMEAGWVKPGRRRETPGRPLTWVTTTSFMDHFGLESMNELPGLDELKASGLLDRRPAIDTLPGTGDLFAQEDEDLAADAEGDDEEGYESEEEGEFSGGDYAAEDSADDETEEDELSEDFAEEEEVE